jgi:Ca2+-binding EF-hand superfamily protein
MKATCTLIALTFALSLSIAPAAPEEGAAQKKADPEKIFKRKDADNDSVLTKEEFLKNAKDATKASTLFGKKDKNSDGKLTLEEYKAVAKKKKKATE